MAKRRLDVLLLERGLVESREKAQVAVMAGDVLVDDRPAVKAASLVDEAAILRLVERPRHRGRGRPLPAGAPGAGGPGDRGRGVHLPTTGAAGGPPPAAAGRPHRGPVQAS